MLFRLQWHELPSEDSCLDVSGGSTIDSSETQVVVNTALVARIEALEAASPVWSCCVS